MKLFNKSILAVCAVLAFVACDKSMNPAAPSNVSDPVPAAPSPVVNPTIGAPEAHYPVGDLRVTSLNPVLAVGNAQSSNVVGQLSYTFEVAEDSSFGRLIMRELVMEQSGETRLQVTQELRSNTRYFWRAQASSGSYKGPHSGTQSFMTPGNNIPPVDPRAPHNGPPDEELLLKSLSEANPGMIQNCEGRPIVTDFLVKSIRTLQAKNGRWGFFKKPDGRIPRDVVAFAWSDQLEGSEKVFVIDFVGAGCDNSPGSPDFSKPAKDARVVWIVTNPSGVANNGVWSQNP